ncbi:MAG: N-acetylmuramoyl-L-alanine amidase [Desulfobacteraceae bacterium]|nr:N-acetylmuramoyl-L-alanine amidase [Desulfobacteraceae bacterium]
MIFRGFVPAALICLLMVFWSCASIGTTPNQLYFSAESCYQNLKDSPQRQKYRSCWLDCIRQFEAVQGQDPDGPWAAAGLFMAGKLYREMYSHSYAPADLRKARSIFREVEKKYPSSAYSKDARQALERMEQAPRQADTKEAEKQYFSAESCYQKLKDSPQRKKYRSNWLNCIRKFKKVHETDPDGPWAAAGLFMTAELYQGLYEHSYKPEDLEKARSVFRRITDDYPSSAYSRQAREQLNAMKDDGETRQEASPETTSGEVTTDTAAQTTSPEEGDPTTVTGIRYWSNPEYTRVVVDANQETDFKNNLLNKDPSINQPHQRLYVDLEDSRLGNDIQEQLLIDDTLLKDVRAGQHDRDTVRVVVDIKSFEDYNIFSLKNPFRIVIDVRGQASAEKKGKAPADSGPSMENGASIAKQLALGVRRIIIDPGHGGRDYGAPGYIKGVHEKDVVLDISKKLAEQLRQELNCEVLLTRSSDKYLTLEERTAIANTKKADLFVSLHANASRNHNAYGIETYFLNLTTDEDSIAVAARENATSEKNISELQNILDDLMRNAKVNESSRLATYVQNALYGNLENNYSRIKNKGVKQAPFYVLLGAQMPSVLIETSFISNKRECSRLTDPGYQRELCSGIVKGVKRYIQKTRPTAFLSSGEGD